MEQDIPGSVWQVKEGSQNDACIKFYNASRPIYMESDASCFGFGAGLLQVRDGMNCWCGELPDQCNTFSK